MEGDGGTGNLKVTIRTDEMTGAVPERGKIALAVGFTFAASATERGLEHLTRLTD